VSPDPDMLLGPIVDRPIVAHAPINQWSELSSESGVRRLGLCAAVRPNSHRAPTDCIIEPYFDASFPDYDSERVMAYAIQQHCSGLASRRILYLQFGLPRGSLRYVLGWMYGAFHLV